MRGRKPFALLLVLALSGSALALQQQRLYRTVTEDEVGTVPTADGVVLIQQHSVFVEIIVEERHNVPTFFHFAAVVGLVKKCKEVRNVFDNAVLWFNDQFLFGNKTNTTVNVTPPDALGQNPNRTISSSDLLDPNRNNGTGQYNGATGGHEVDQVGTGPNEGGNPDRDGFVRASDNRERWGGCFIPNGFVHAIGSDDPYGVGDIGWANASVDDGTSRTNVAQRLGTDHHGPISNIELTKQLIDLDHACEGCLFEYVASYFITDPNNHRWIVDKLVYPLTFTQQQSPSGQTAGEDPTNCHVGPQKPQDDLPLSGGCGIEEDQSADSYESLPRQTQELGLNPVTDHNGDERFKITTKEPIYTVHVQVDPWNPDRQGFPDEAIWAYRQDGRLRLGMPYTEDPNNRCHDLATIEGDAVGPGSKPAAYEYDNIADEGGPAQDPPPPPAPAPNPDPDVTSVDWTEYRRGPVGNTVECAIEYNFLLAVDFEAFDNALPTRANASVPQSTTGVVGADAEARSQEEQTGENEILRNAKDHGDGGADDADKAWQGNSHPHAPKECAKNATGAIVCTALTPGAPTDSGPRHQHDAITLDLFFYARAPAFVEQNPYWDHANETDVIKTTGTPPIWDQTCTDAPQLPFTDYRRQAVIMRNVGRCDVDAVQGFHLHDGSQTIQTPPQEGGPTRLDAEADPSGARVNTGPNGPNPSAP